MSKYKIPEPFLPGVRIIANLQPDQLSALSETLNTASVGEYHEEFGHRISKNEKLKFTTEQSMFVAQSIFSLIVLKLSVSDRDKDYLKDISESYSHNFDPKERDSVFNQTLNNLTSLLSTSSNLESSVKAHLIVSEFERIYTSSRVLTDIRMIFNHTDISTQTKAAVLVHNLKLIYRENQEDLNEIFFTLTTSDLNDLKKTIDRALDKAKLIEKEGFSSEIKFITTKKENQ